MIPFAPKLMQPFGGGRAFNPLTLSPALWLSDTGSDPAQWDDLSGNGRHAVQATSGNQPAIVTNALNGRQVRRVTGISRTMLGSFGSEQNYAAMSVFAVFNHASDTKQYGRVYTQKPNTENDFAASGHYIPILSNGNIIDPRSFSSYANGNIEASLPPVNAGTPCLVSSIHTGSIISNRLNGGTAVAFAHTLGNNSHDYAVGGTIYGNPTDADDFRGDIAEIIVLPYAATTTQREQVENYLRIKYALY